MGESKRLVNDRGDETVRSEPREPTCHDGVRSITVAEVDIAEHPHRAVGELEQRVAAASSVDAAMNPRSPERVREPSGEEMLVKRKAKVRATS